MEGQMLAGRSRECRRRRSVPALNLQTLLQPCRMAHPQSLSHPLWVGSAIFRMQVAEGCAGAILKVGLDFIHKLNHLFCYIKLHLTMLKSDRRPFWRYPTCDAIYTCLYTSRSLEQKTNNRYLVNICFIMWPQICENICLK